MYEWSQSDSEEPEMVRGETTIAMTPSSRKSMVAQFFENETEDQSSPDPIEIVEEDEVQIQGIKWRFYLHCVQIQGLNSKLILCC